MYIFRLQHIWRDPLAFCFPLLTSLCSPFYSPLLTWNPPYCDRIRPPWSQVARKLISPFPSLPIPSPFRNPNPLGFSRAKCVPTKMTSPGLQVQNRSLSSVKFKFKYPGGIDSKKKDNCDIDLKQNINKNKDKFMSKVSVPLEGHCSEIFLLHFNGLGLWFNS
jgi:hypothetical protein